MTVPGAQDGEKLLEGLNDAQLEAVTHIDGPLMVVAGAGSGKTRVVTRRIAYLIHRGVWPSQILAMTFTNKAAKEMCERVTALVGNAPAWVGTFHSVCARILRQDIEKLDAGRDRRFTIYDADDQKSLIKKCMEEHGVDTKRHPPAAVQAQISRCKCAMMSPSEMASSRHDGWILAETYTAYQEALRTANSLDFDDLLVLVIRLLEEIPAVREVYQHRFRHLLIDEYQDTNRLQYSLMHLLTGPARNVHVTGDPDQSIYSWRGAEYRNIMDFPRDFPDAKVVRLETNYRSTQTILDAANHLIRHNSLRIEKELMTDNGRGCKVVVSRTYTQNDEAVWVANQVLQLQAGGSALEDMAVFYRVNAQSRPFEEALMARGIPYQIIGGIRFYERKEVKDLLAHLKLLANPADGIALERVIGCRPTGVGPKTFAEIEAAARAHAQPVFEFIIRPDFAAEFPGRLTAKAKAFVEWCQKLAAISPASPADCVQQVYEHSQLAGEYDRHRDRDPQAEDRIENMKALVERAAEFAERNPDAGLDMFLAEVALVADVDGWDNSPDQLTLMTLHSAKGLEFPVVFIAGVEQGFLPHNNCQEPDQVEEERRLFYVGITRAQRMLFITLTASRFMWNHSERRLPSPFLRELPAATVEAYDLGRQNHW